jgi:hypothetical protein
VERVSREWEEVYAMWQRGPFTLMGGFFTAKREAGA